MKTIVVNLLGGAGAGKSTIAATLFGELKRKGYNCELVSEYAKTLVYEENMRKLQNQLLIFSKQYYSMDMIRDKVNIIITDSPLLLSMHYNSNFSNANHLRVPDKIFRSLVLYCYSTFDNLNFYIERNHEYKQEGRYQNEERAQKEEKLLKELIYGLRIDITQLLSTDKCVDIICKAVEDRVKYYNNLCKSGLEVEKKYLVEKMPDIQYLKREFILQGYLIRNEKEIRVRNVDNEHFFMTEKYGHGLVREEYEKEISGQEFAKMIKEAGDNIVKKVRHYYPLGNGKVAELDIYVDFDKLKTVEVEFESLEEAESFSPPEWFGKDVTDDFEYKNFSLAQKHSRSEKSQPLSRNECSQKML